MSVKPSYPTIKLEKSFEYVSSSYGDKKKDKLWIMSSYEKNRNNKYITSVLIKKDGSKEFVWAIGTIKSKDVIIELPEQEINKIIENAYQYVKISNYLWES